MAIFKGNPLPSWRTHTNNVNLVWLRLDAAGVTHEFWPGFSFNKQNPQEIHFCPEASIFIWTTKWIIIKPSCQNGQCDLVMESGILWPYSSSGGFCAAETITYIFWLQVSGAMSQLQLCNIKLIGACRNDTNQHFLENETICKVLNDRWQRENALWCAFKVLFQQERGF